MICFSHFRTLDPETADLARELIDASDVQRSAFSSFVNLWMGFNGWMECVTDAATDAEMITALANHQRLTEAYNELMGNAPDFREKVEVFATMWPVLNVRDVRRKLGATHSGDFLVKSLWSKSYVKVSSFSHSIGQPATLQPGLSSFEPFILFAVISSTAPNRRRISAIMNLS